MKVDLQKIYDAIVEGDHQTAFDITKQALHDGVDPNVIVKEYLIPSMDEVGRRFECNEYYVPELLIAARAMKKTLHLINPILAHHGGESKGRVVIGTVKGDVHDIGKNLVGAMLEGAGFEIIDLGIDVSPDAFLFAVREKKPAFVALSALLTTTMPSMKKIIETLEKQGLRENVKILVGGAPVNQRYADEIGADGYGKSASEAVTVARKLSNLL